ncbi:MULTISPECIES: hypothetical protein [Thalassospira]|uniref:Uncharacterized protein n=2 Tax=Thalassospira TaxID=168934 RepID=A0A367WEZ6_9PROT|nr:MULTISPECIES: hypothetical protein [Thalassospira]MDG4718997.1 hypothetical protein [Thalassospira sp. FZY0004]RCK39957.1 hypothetical protein TH19_02680 [Thalassospira profundimaris]
MTDAFDSDNQYSGFLPPRFRDRLDADDVTVKTWTVGDALPDHSVPDLPAPLSVFFDLVAPSAERAGASGFAMLWLDRHPHEEPGWRLSVGHAGDVDTLETAVAKPLARLVGAMSMAEFETENWHMTRPLWRKRSEPVRLVFWGSFAKHARAVLAHGDGASFYQPLGAGLRADHVAASLPLLEDMLGDPFLIGGMGFEDALRLGISLGRAHLIESWIEAGGPEKEPYFRPMRIWHQAWLANALIDPAVASLAMSGKPPMPALDFAANSTPDTRRRSLDEVSGWLTSVFFTDEQPALRNAFVAGVQNAVWLDSDLQQYLQPQQRTEIVQGLMPYCRWFLAMALYNHLGNLAAGTARADQIEFYSTLVDALPELSPLGELATQRDIELHIIRIDAARAASAFDTLVLPFCDILMPRCQFDAARS